MRFFFFFFIPIFLFSQEKNKDVVVASENLSGIGDETNIFMFALNYSHQFPEFDLKNRFGPNSAIGISLTKKNNSNYLFTFSGNWIIGNNIKEENIFNPIDGNNGDIINIDGQIPIIRLFERGAQLHFDFGKKIELNINNAESGIIPSFGLGYVYHKIFIETLMGEIPQLNENLLKGYDRLTGGFSLKQSIMFMYLSNNQKINFHIGLEIIECWTKDLRIQNYSTGITENENRFDLFIGLKAGWILPLRKRTTSSFYYY